MKISFIDLGTKDFIRDESGRPIIIKTNNPDEAATWLLKNGAALGWQMNGTRYFDWQTATLIKQK